MKRTYIKAFFGTNEAVEAGIRKFDQIFRQMYNVYGGRREYSGKDADGNYEVIMSYTADWDDLDGLFPEYRIESIARRFYLEACRLPKEYNDNFWCDVIKEDDGTYARKG